jgi:hypothetical protein
MRPPVACARMALELELELELQLAAILRAVGILGVGVSLDR